MKKVLNYLFAAAFVVVGCNNEHLDDVPIADDAKKGALYLSVSDGNLFSKASETSSVDYEKVVANVQVLVFDENDLLVAYHDAGTTLTNITLYVAEGMKDVWAVVNGPSLTAISKKEQLLEYGITLDGSNDLTGVKGFVMSGHASVNVSALTPASANIIVERLVSRVRLANVSNDLPSAYSSLTVESVCLTNVVGNQNLSGTAVETVWYNRMGTSNGTQSMIIDGVTNMAELPSYTFVGTDKSLSNGQSYAPGYYFYSYPNSTAVDVDGWSDPFTARMSRLVLSVRIDGTLYYYPVVLNRKLERNKSYDVEVSIVSLGTTAPWEELKKGSIYCTITVKDWQPGDSYSETI